MYLVVMYIVPFTCLALFNLRIYIQIRRANMERAKLSRLQKREIGMATMLICVVIVFFACNVLALVANVLEVIKVMDFRKSRQLGKIRFLVQGSISEATSLNLRSYHLERE